MVVIEPGHDFGNDMVHVLLYFERKREKRTTGAKTVDSAGRNTALSVIAQAYSGGKGGKKLDTNRDLDGDTGAGGFAA